VAKSGAAGELGGEVALNIRAHQDMEMDVRADGRDGRAGLRDVQIAPRAQKKHSGRTILRSRGAAAKGKASYRMRAGLPRGVPS